MKYQIVARSQRQGHPFMIRLEDGRLIRDQLLLVHRKVPVGETGVIVQEEYRSQRFIRDAIDVDYQEV